MRKDRRQISVPWAPSRIAWLALCRMKARWLKQSAAMLAEDHPGDTALAGKVQSKAEEMLRTK